VTTLTASLLGGGAIRSLIVGTHSAALHRGVLDLLAGCKHGVVFEDPEPAHQPDGIIVSRFAS
jgi:hypothetical protein